MLLADPVFHELATCGQASNAAPPRSFVKLLSRLSVGVLSLQFSFRLIEQAMP